MTLTALGPILVDIDVTEAAALGQAAHLATWLFCPNPVQYPTPKALLICVPGGSYSKSYWHLTVPGYTDYSFGEYMADEGLSRSQSTCWGPATAIGRQTTPTPVRSLRAPTRN